MTEVVNAHHYGGSDNLPPDVVYIGRPSKHGNRYSSKSGKLTREECVAFNRMDIYEHCVEDATYFPSLKAELEGRKLACWCKNPKRHIACHGDNFVHIFRDEFKDRDYKKSVMFYLLEDLRFAITALRKWVITEVPDEEFVDLYLAVYEAKLEVGFLFSVISTIKPEPRVICEYLSRIVIELELALADPDVTMKSYWLRHVGWTIGKLVLSPGVVGEEPPHPQLMLKRKKKV